MSECAKTLQYDEVTRRVWCDTCGHEAFIPIKVKRPVKRTPTIAELTAELKELREFVGAIKRMEFNGLLGRYEGKEFWFYGDDHKIVATGTDPFDAWRKMNAGEGE